MNKRWPSEIDPAKRALLRPGQNGGRVSILKCLRPIWTDKPETARPVQQRIERILSAADVLGHRTGRNPAQWKGHLEQVLPGMRHVRQRHAAMPYADLPGYTEGLAPARL